MQLQSNERRSSDLQTIQSIQRESSFPGLLVNFDRAEAVRIDGELYSRLCIKTPLVTCGVNLEAFVQEYAEPFLQPGDILIVTEKIVAITQGRAMRSIKSGQVCWHEFFPGLSPGRLMESGWRCRRQCNVH